MSRPDQRGFVLLDALAAMVVGAGVLVGVYALISAGSRGSASARDAAFAATAAHALCLELSSSSHLEAGRTTRTQGGIVIEAAAVQEVRPNLPQVALWRIDCIASRDGVPLAAEQTFALKGASSP